MLSQTHSKFELYHFNHLRMQVIKNKLNMKGVLSAKHTHLVQEASRVLQLELNSIQRVELSNYLFSIAFGDIALLTQCRKVTHYFIAPGVADFCEECVKEISSDYYKRFPVCPPVEGYHKEEILPGGCLFHFPVSENRKSLVVIPGYNGYSELKPFATQAYRELLQCDFLVSDGSSCNPTWLRTSDDSSTYQYKSNLSQIRTVLGLSLYMDAFPDALTETDPGLALGPLRAESKCYTVKRNATVEEEASNAKSPHWRRGHYRLLTSEYFKHKCGQTVFIKGSFVNGAKAYDVNDDAPPLTKQEKEQ